MNSDSSRKLLWTPSGERITDANMTRFIEFVNTEYKQQLRSYNNLYTWSIENRVDFWEGVWKFVNIKASEPYHTVLIDSEDMIGAKWFMGSRLNFAENLLRYRDEKTALIFKGEDQGSISMTYAKLYDNVARLAKSLREMGVTTGDRVAGFIPNMSEAVIAMLAAASIGAIWSSCSPDFGIKGVLDRFGQIKPKVLFTANGYSYDGKVHDSLPRITEAAKKLPSIEKIIVVPYKGSNGNIGHLRSAIWYQDFISQKTELDIVFEQLPFNHPLYIMYSSGTTGLPKCMVHGTGGTLIQHLKELILHTDLKRNDTIFYFTTCGWMMWNWLVSSLAVGCSVLLFDGSPFYPDPGALFKLTEDERISVFGTSAKYLASLENAGVKPGKQFDLGSLKAILSTGSPLSTESFDYVYREIKKDCCLSSISGGTDIISCFGVGNPIGPVYSGELQCRGLGMKVEAFDSNGKSVVEQKGELVCTASFPSMPIYFWNDKTDKKYKEAYFKTYPDTWHHGDYVEIKKNGGLIIYGRSDATLNPGGVRIGTAEIYRQVESLDEISDSIVVGQDWKNDVRVILFVELSKGVELTLELKKKIKRTIKENTTPRHIPARIIAVKEIPYTINMKKVEIAVKNVIHNRPNLNLDALANPGSLKCYENIPELRT